MKGERDAESGEVFPSRPGIWSTTSPSSALPLKMKYFALAPLLAFVPSALAGLEDAKFSVSHLPYNVSLS